MARSKNYVDTNVKCSICGYANLKHNAEMYGTCTGCGAVLDPKAKFKHDMYKELRLWRKQSGKKH